MRSFPAVLLPVLALSVLVACGGDDDSGDSAESTSASPTSEESSPSSPGSSSPGSSSPSASGSPGAASPGQVPRPASGQCEPVPESADGRYDLGDAGEVTLRLQDGGGLTVDVRSSGGWSTAVDSDDDEAEIEFTRNGEELDLEAEVQGGRLVIQICADDDD